MTDKTSFTLAGDWSKPAQILIEKMSDAVGGALRPWQTERVARAEARAALIKTESDIKSNEMLEIAGLGNSPIGERAIKRMISTEVRKQINIEEIAHKALQNLKDDAKPEELDPDFVSELFEKAANTSNQDIQSLWASILAGEANVPGSFSKRTIGVVASLDQRDAELFTRFCSCCWMLGNNLISITTESCRKLLELNGVTFDELIHLDAIGLIRFDTISGFAKSFEHNGAFPVRLNAHYFGSPFVIEFTSPPLTLDTGQVLLTVAGKELAAISGAKSSGEFVDAVVQGFVSEHVSLHSPWPRRSE